MPTKQETFDIVAKHLLTQNAKAISVLGWCVYRTENGLKCAAGCLIPDDKYKPEFEGRSVIDCGDISKAGMVIESLGHDLSFCRELQEIHDCCLPSEWSEKLKELANTHGLIANF